MKKARIIAHPMLVVVGSLTGESFRVYNQPTGCILDMGLKENLLDKSGSWWSHGDVKIGQGRENARQYLKEHPELMDDLESIILDRYIRGRRPTTPDEPVN